MQNFDPESPLLIAQAVLGSATGSTLAAFKAQNPYALGMNMGLNGSIAGLTFFGKSPPGPASSLGIREYLVSPLLLTVLSPYSSSYHARSASLQPVEHQITSPPPSSSSLTRVRNDRLLDSALAGGLTGGMISWTFRGRKTFPRSALTSGLITAFGQYVVNNIRVARLELLARRSSERRAQEEEAEVGQMQTGGVGMIAGSSEQTSSAADTTSTGSALSSTSTSTSPPSTPDSTSTSDFPTLSTRLVDFFRSLSPVRKISDFEYLRILERQRDEMQADLSAWEERMRGRYALEGRGEARPESSGKQSSSSSSSSSADSKSAAGTGQTVDIGQLMRQLDGVERRIKSLEVKIASEGPEAAGRV